MTINELVYKYLVEVPETRKNDNLLIAYVVRDMYGMENLFDIALSTSNNIYESIRRVRAKIQNEINPLLQADDNVRQARQDKQLRVREAMRGL